jgi:2-phospho-L-lactate transferase/gluconeogenesis factor (CofD/UPF0052 family)
MTQANETLGMTAAGHVRALHEHAGFPLFDAVMVNCAPVNFAMLSHYAIEGATPVPVDSDALAALGVRVVQGNYLADGPVARHDAAAVGRDLLDLSQADKVAAEPALAA